MLELRRIARRRQNTPWMSHRVFYENESETSAAAAAAGDVTAIDGLPLPGAGTK